MKDNFFNLIFITIILIGMIWYHDNYIMPFNKSKKSKIKNKIINKHIDIEEVNRVYQESNINLKNNDNINKPSSSINKEQFSDDLGSLLNSESGFSLGKIEIDNNANELIDDNSLLEDNKSFDSKFSDDF